MCFYKEGLRFSCKNCGCCCTGFPGFVWLKKNEIKTIADFLKIEQDAFLKNYTFTAYGRISLKEKIPSYDCIFFKNKKCLIYPVRPFQCQAFPFWPGHLQEESDWENLKRHCPGVGEGKLHSKEEIEKLLKMYNAE